LLPPRHEVGRSAASEMTNPVDTSKSFRGKQFHYSLKKSFPSKIPSLVVSRMYKFGKQTQRAQFTVRAGQQPSRVVTFFREPIPPHTWDTTKATVVTKRTACRITRRAQLLYRSRNLKDRVLPPSGPRGWIGARSQERNKRNKLISHRLVSQAPWLDSETATFCSGVHRTTIAASRRNLQECCFAPVFMRVPST
jgi:hypothetical protein